MRNEQGMGYEPMALDGKGDGFRSVRREFYESFDEYVKAGKGQLLDEYYMQNANAPRLHSGVSSFSRVLADLPFASSPASARQVSPARRSISDQGIQNDVLGGPQHRHTELSIRKERGEYRYENPGTVRRLCRLASKLHYDMILEPHTLISRLSQRIRDQDEVDIFLKDQRRVWHSLLFIVVSISVLLFLPWAYAQKCTIEKHLADQVSHWFVNKARNMSSECDVQVAMELPGVDFSFGLILAVIPCVCLFLVGCCTQGLRALAVITGEEEEEEEEEEDEELEDDKHGRKMICCGQTLSILNFKRLLCKPLLLLWYHHIDVHMSRLKYNNSFNLFSTRNWYELLNGGSHEDVPKGCRRICCNVHSPMSLLASLTYLVLVLEVLLIAAWSGEVILGCALAFAMATIYFFLGNCFMGGTDRMIMLSTNKIGGNSVLQKLSLVTQTKLHEVSFGTQDLKNLQVIEYNSEAIAAARQHHRDNGRQPASRRLGFCSMWWGCGEEQHQDRAEEHTMIDGIGIITDVYLEDTQQILNLVTGSFRSLHVGREDLPDPYAAEYKWENSLV